MQHPNVRLPRRRFLANVATAGAAATLLPLSMEEAQGKDPARPERFKYAVCNELFAGWPFEKAFAFAAKCGYTGVEIAPFTMWEKGTGPISRNGPEGASRKLDLSPFPISAARRTEVRQLAKRAGLEVVGLHWLLGKTVGFHLTSPDAAVRRKTAAYLGELARLCADLGGRIMVLGSPQQRNLAAGMSKQQGMKYAAEVLRAAAPTLEKTKVVIALEPLGPVETNFLMSAAEGAELVALVDSPTCRLHLDCKAMAAEKGDCPNFRPSENGTVPFLAPSKTIENGPEGASQKSYLSPFPSQPPIPEIIHKYRKVLVHFHANDPNRQGPGFGKLDFVPIMKALAEINYRGWVSVEPGDFTPGVERLARESITYLRKCAAKNA